MSDSVETVVLSAASVTAIEAVKHFVTSPAVSGVIQFTIGILTIFYLMIKIYSYAKQINKKDP